MNFTISRSIHTTFDGGRMTSMSPAGIKTLLNPYVTSPLSLHLLTKKAQQRMHFLRQLKKFNLPKSMMVHFYTSVIESILTSSGNIRYT